MSVLVIEPEASDPVGPLGDWLTDAGLDLAIVRPFAGEPLPADLDEIEGLIVLGGSMGAGDDADYPYLADIRRLLAEAVAREVPTLGICLGAQLLAVATGGTVTRSPDGPEYGAQLIAKRANAATDPLFGPIPITPDVIQWHVDAITDLPPGAVHLASSPVCANQAFRLGRLAWGIQFHIETTPQLLRSWADEDAARAGRLRRRGDPGAGGRGRSRRRRGLAAVRAAVRRDRPRSVVGARPPVRSG